MKANVPKYLPLTGKFKEKNSDYLNIGTFGGSSSHFAVGSGIYGFNWWFNHSGLLHPDKLSWPDGSLKTFITIGAGGNNMLIIPEFNIILASANGNWGNFEPDNPNNNFNIYIKLLIKSNEK